MRPDAGDRPHDPERRRWARPARRWTGKDLHVGDFDLGASSAAAPLAISALTVAGMAMAFALRGRGPRRRLATSARARRRSASGTRPSTSAPRAGSRRSSASRTTRPRCRRRSPSNPPCACSPRRRRGTASPASRSTEPIRTRSPPAFAWAAERARAGLGPALIELVRDAHVRPRAPRRHALPRQGPAALAGSYPPPTDGGLRGSRRVSPSGRGATRSRRTPRARAGSASSASGDLDRDSKTEAEALVEAEARAVIELPGPTRRAPARTSSRASRRAGTSSRSNPPLRAAREPPRRSRRRREAPAVRRRRERPSSKRSCWASATRCAPTRASSSTARTSAASTATPSCSCSPLLAEFGDRILNSPIAEGGVLGVCVGAALAGHAADRRDAVQRLRRDRLQPARQQRREDPLPLGRLGARWSCACRGAACAAPVRTISQNTEAWFYRTPGLEDRLPLDAARRARAAGRGGRRSRPGPLLRAHRALPRAADQAGARRRTARADPDRKGARCGARARISRSCRTAPTSTSRCASPERSPKDGVEAPCSTCAASRRSTARPLLDRRAALRQACSSSTRTRAPAAIGESLAAIIQEERFEDLDAPGAHRRRARCPAFPTRRRSRTRSSPARRAC